MQLGVKHRAFSINGKYADHYPSTGLNSFKIWPYTLILLSHSAADLLPKKIYSDDEINPGLI